MRAVVLGLVLVLAPACVDDAPGARVPMEARARLTLERTPCEAPTSCEGVESATVDLGAYTYVSRSCVPGAAGRAFVETERTLTEDEQTRLRIVLAQLRYEETVAETAAAAASLAIDGPEYRAR